MIQRDTRSDVSFHTKLSEYLVTVDLTSHTYTPLSETLRFFTAVCSPPRHGHAKWLGLCQLKCLSSTVSEYSHDRSRRSRVRFFAFVPRGGIWCVEEVFNYHGQEAGRKCGLDSGRNKCISSSGSSAQDRYCARGPGADEKKRRKKRRRVKTNLLVAMFLLRVTYIIFDELFCNWNGAVQFVSHEVWSDKEFVIWHFVHCCFSQVGSLWSLSIWIRIIFRYQWICELKKTLKSNAPQTRFLYVKKSAAVIFCVKTMRLVKEHVPQARFFRLNPDGFLWCVSHNSRSQVRIFFL